MADIHIVEASSDLWFDRSLLTGERCIDHSIFFLLSLFSSSKKRHGPWIDHVHFRQRNGNPQPRSHIHLCGSGKVHQHRIRHGRQNHHGSHCCHVRRNEIQAHNCPKGGLVLHQDYFGRGFGPFLHFNHRMGGLVEEILSGLRDSQRGYHQLNRMSHGIHSS